jgi:hypothetical protein
MKIRRIALTVVFIALNLVLLSCGRPSVPTAMPTLPIPKLSERSPDIRGIVMEVYIHNQNLGGFFVEGKKETDTTYAKALVGMTKDTQFFFKQEGFKQEGTYAIATAADLQVGKTVEVLFTGPILTSDPVQATALEIIIAQ